MHRTKLSLILVLIFVIIALCAGIVFAILYSLRRNNFRYYLIQKCDQFGDTIYPSLKSKLSCELYADAFDLALSEEGSACRNGTYDYFLNLTITPEMYAGRIATLWSGREAGKRVEALFNEGKPFLPLNRVLAGFIMSDRNVCDGAMWKGYNGCKGCDLDVAKGVYWKSASHRFASLIEGQFNILLESNYTPYVRDTSILMTVEIPSLRPEEIKSSVIYVYHNCTQNGIDQCEEASVKDLIAILKGRQIPTNCKSCTGLPQM